MSPLLLLRGLANASLRPARALALWFEGHYISVSCEGAADLCFPLSLLGYCFGGKATQPLNYTPFLYRVALTLI